MFFIVVYPITLWQNCIQSVESNLSEIPFTMNSDYSIITRLSQSRYFIHKSRISHSQLSDISTPISHSEVSDISFSTLSNVSTQAHFILK